MADDKTLNSNSDTDGQINSDPNPNDTGNDGNVGNDDVDDKGVSYKNRYAEAERKRRQLEESVEEMTLRLNKLESASVPTPPVQTPQQSQPTTQADLDEMIKIGPKAYTEKVQRELRRQEQMMEAESLIKEKFGAGRAQFGFAKVLDYAQQNYIDLNTNPVKAVSKILADMDKPKSKPSADDIKKTKDAIKNKPEGGKRPPAPAVDKSSGLMKNVYERGSVEDVAAALEERWKSSDQ